MVMMVCSGGGKLQSRRRLLLEEGDGKGCVRRGRCVVRDHINTEGKMGVKTVYYAHASYN